MRKITQQAILAFNASTPFQQSNTTVTVNNSGNVELSVFDNIIAHRNTNKGSLHITNAGWKSNTTRERLNGLKGVNITQKAGKEYLNGKVWGGEWTKIK